MDYCIVLADLVVHSLFIVAHILSVICLFKSLFLACYLRLFEFGHHLYEERRVVCFVSILQK